MEIKVGPEAVPAVARAVKECGHKPEQLVIISFNAANIAESKRQMLFDPFYSGREAGRGLGFGLAKCWRIVTDHGGRLEVESEAGRGAKFAIVLGG